MYLASEKETLHNLTGPTTKPNTSIVILNNKLPDTVSSQILPEKVGSNAVSMASSKHLIQGKDISFNNINDHDHDNDYHYDNNNSNNHNHHHHSKKIMTSTRIATMIELILVLNLITIAKRLSQ